MSRWYDTEFIYIFVLREEKKYKIAKRKRKTHAKTPDKKKSLRKVGQNTILTEVSSQRILNNYLALQGV